MDRAVSASQAGAVDFLLKARADPMLRNQEGKNCLEIAEAQENKRMQSLLQNLMKKMEFSSLDKSDSGESGLSPKAGGQEKQSIFKALFKDKAAQKFFPIFWIVCVSLATFEYLTDLRIKGYEVAPTASLLFELGVPISLIMFAWIVLADPG